MSVDERDPNLVPNNSEGGKPQGERRDFPDRLPPDTPDTPDVSPQEAPGMSGPAERAPGEGEKGPAT